MRKKVFFIISILIGLLILIEPSSQARFNNHPDFDQWKDLVANRDYQVGELVIKLKDKQPTKIRVPQNLSIQEKVQEVLKNSQVEYAEPNFIAQILMTPNDPYYSPYQWNFEQIGMSLAWESVTGQAVVVAVVDTGIKEVQDLTQTQFVSGYDFVANDSNPSDENGHGTHVAGTIAQSTNNNFGVAGIAFNAKLMPVRVLDRNGRGSYFDIAQGIRWAVDRGAKIINLSLGAPYYSTTLRDAVKYAYEQGVTVIAAAGNDGKVGSGKVLYPAAFDDYVLAVGGVRYDGMRAYYSNGGPSLDLMAPGGDLNVDQNNDGYGDGILQHTFKRGQPAQEGFYFYQGTSMAAAHVSGVAALLVEKGLQTPDAVWEQLKVTAQDLGLAGWDEEYGFGLVDAAAAVGAENGVPPSTPTPTPTSTLTPTLTPTPTPTPTPTLILTVTPTPPVTPTLTPTPTQADQVVPTPTPNDAYERMRQRICARYPWWWGCK